MEATMKRPALLAFLLLAAAALSPGQQLTVLSPNGGEELASGEPLVIAWSFSDLAGDETVVIALEGEEDFGPVAIAAVSQGGVEWPAGRKMDGSFARPAAGYRIRITVRANESVSDVSDGAFTLAEPLPVVALVSPNGGEELSAGRVCPIRWSSAAGGLVTLALLQGDRELGTIAADLPSASLSFAWRVGAELLNGAACPLGDGLRVAIRWRPAAGGAPPAGSDDRSDGTFAIRD
jgi:hypothetical protein